ncbi:MAG: zinc ribbon domain-containing protein [Thermoleophilia bacterium]|nr:zinc ribbon domain-containing protein [Thermoleophilia bacterium]
MDNNLSRTAAPTVFCRSCASPLVQALDWDEEEESLWGVRLWCPECGFEQAAILDRSQLFYLALAIEEGFGRMLDALDELSRMSSLPEEPDLVDRAKTDRMDCSGR